MTRAGISVIGEDGSRRCGPWATSTRCRPSSTGLGRRPERRGLAAAVAVAVRAPHDRYRPHPLGHAWAGDRGERPPALRLGDRFHVVVNGIVENYMTLKERLLAAGSVFTSETDAEVIAHLIAEHYDGDLADAVRARLRRTGGPLRVRRDVPGGARDAGGSTQGVPADRRPGRGRAVRRLRGARLPGADARGAVRGQRRDRRADPRRRHDHDARRRGGGARGGDGRLGRGHRREGRV